MLTAVETAIDQSNPGSISIVGSSIFVGVLLSSPLPVFQINKSLKKKMRQGMIEIIGLRENDRIDSLMDQTRRLYSYNRGG